MRVDKCCCDVVGYRGRFSEVYFMGEEAEKDHEFICLKTFIIQFLLFNLPHQATHPITRLNRTPHNISLIKFLTIHSIHYYLNPLKKDLLLLKERLHLSSNLCASAV